MSVQVVLAFGSNLGDRVGHLQAGLDALCASGVWTPRVVSSVFETEPVGGPEQGAFLNAVAVGRSAADPRDVLAACQDAERGEDRRRELRWGPRTLDVDVVSFGDVRSDDPVLTLPHPRAHERAFVLVPWADADPGACFVPFGQSAAQRVVDLAACADDAAGVRRVDVEWVVSS